MFKFIVLFHSEGCQFSHPASTGACGICWKEMTSGIVVEETVVNTFFSIQVCGCLEYEGQSENKFISANSRGCQVEHSPWR